MNKLMGESPILTIARVGQVEVSGIKRGNNLYESPD